MKLMALIAVHGFKGCRFSSQIWIPAGIRNITKAELQDVYIYAGRTRAAIRGFIKYLLSYEQGRQKSNPEP